MKKLVFEFDSADPLLDRADFVIWLEGSLAKYNKQAIDGADPLVFTGQYYTDEKFYSDEWIIKARTLKKNENPQ